MRTTRHTQPVAVREIVATALHAMTHEYQHAAPIDFTTWKTLVGPRAVRHTQPASLRRGRLVVHVADAALLYELSLRTPELLAGLRRALPERDIREIRFRIGAVRW